MAGSSFLFLLSSAVLCLPEQSYDGSPTSIVVEARQNLRPRQVKMVESQEICTAVLSEIRRMFFASSAAWDVVFGVTTKPYDAENAEKLHRVR